MSTTWKPPTEAPRDEQLLKAVELVRNCRHPGFYGKLTLIFEDGHLVRITREESIKPAFGGPRE